MSFVSDRTFGESYQQKCLEIFEHDEHEIKSGYFKDWDVRLKHGDIEHLLEVKADRYAKRTNCLAIEYAFKGKPSGITDTKATAWVHFVDGTNILYNIPVPSLRRLIARKKYLRDVVGGDGRNSQLYIFSSDIFEKFRVSY